MPLLSGHTGPISPAEIGAFRRLKMMNETVYLFALSLPDLLDRIVTDRDESRAPVPQPISPAPLG